MAAVAYLNPYILCKCIHMKYGTILYRKGIDTLVSLSWAMGACSSTHLDEVQSISESISKENRQRAVFYEAECIINDLLHEEIDELAKLKKETKTPDSLLLSIDAHTQSINPLLIDFITLITSTTRERQCSSVTCENDKSSHVKKVFMSIVI